MWKIIFEDKAFKLLSKLEKSAQKEILHYLNRKELLQNPRNFGKALLHEKKDNWRYRVGDYRLICRFENKELIVLVLDVGHRKEIYK